jgi:hypothetical protein
MGIRSFHQYMREQSADTRSHVQEPSVTNSFEIVQDGVEIIINITLTKDQQHTEVVRFLRRIADELSILERAATQERQR